MTEAQELHWTGDGGTGEPGKAAGMQVGFFLCGGSMKTRNPSAAPPAKADYERSNLEHGASSWASENKRHLENDVQLAETLSKLNSPIGPQSAKGEAVTLDRFLPFLELISIMHLLF
ncbi:hypothetical protein AAES_156671 [Amazona aestiva]|uniref:Uncharacterized protein n=1 Tax=Amazona aestiva TaxID=12930 RepID=A0A0Q3LVD8_AMAAE|nr:hypothetical protein AAES_156671 [Amazona aestiva]